ncbi:protease complex subunit PrcB family protein [Flavobacterium sp.]|uniref:protease complex subunit PrcB family protein n=1 Tax=Flavobacterium sp. TaxID=239 RepID=UPI00260D1F18|nr:protease complex subunit PrcB family protein [Flavobacterium sp.]MDD3004073.1 protease complex subunit PrcB family protein [Flavobacterium sp.]
MKALYFIPVAILLFSCKGAKSDIKTATHKKALFTTLYSSAYQGRDTEENVVITNQKSLEELYMSVNNEEVPTIDFSKNQVVALFLGTKNTGGHAIAIDRVEAKEGKIIVYKKIQKPDRDAMVTLALTNPFVIAEIHSKNEIEFK